MNPGSPAPQASVIIRTRLRAQTTRLAPSPQVKGKIVNTLLKLKNSGLQEQTFKILGFYLRHLAVNSDLSEPDSVKEFSANKNVNNGFKGNLVKAYNYYTLINNMVWERPKYRWEQNKPRIPSEEILNKIILSCGWKYKVIFTLLKETGAMPIELSRVTLRDIDFDRETISIRGRKGHSSRTIKLKNKTSAMLQVYLSKIGEKNCPFPESKWMTKSWVKYKKRQSKKLNDRSLLTIRLYNLRHYQACKTYNQTKDVSFKKQKLCWKKLETALFYLQYIDFGAEEYHSSTAKTVDEAKKLVEQGFEYFRV